MEELDSLGIGRLEIIRKCKLQNNEQGLQEDSSPHYHNEECLDSIDIHAYN